MSASQPVLPALNARLDAMGLGPAHPLRVLLVQREAQGLKTYGTRLHTNNGRCALRDVAEEVADAAMYAVQYDLECKASAAKHAVQHEPLSWVGRLIQLATFIAEIESVVASARAERDGVGG